MSRDNALTLHEQIRRAILTDIWEGLYRPGDLLPSEKELSAHFGVNRLTVRQAVHALASQGHVRPMQGRGYQVRATTLSADLLTVSSTSHSLQELGLEAKTRTLGTTVVSAQPEVAEALGLRRGADTIKIVRQRLAHDVLIALDEVYYDADKFQGLLEADLDRHSLTETLVKNFDLRIGRVATTLQAGVAGERAELLDSAPGSPVLIASTLMFDLEESPVELGISFYHSERIKLTVHAPVDPASWPYGAR